LRNFLTAVTIAGIAAILAVQGASARSSASHSSGSHSSGSHSSGSHSSGSHSSAHSGHPGHSKAVPGVKRDAHGHIARSADAKHDFRKSHPCPSTGKTSGKCPGYVVDHVTPLKRGGADAPSNMQWQSAQDAKRKDAWE
jgi:hypothetical protein